MAAPKLPLNFRLTKVATAIKAENPLASAKPKTPNALMLKPPASKWLSSPASFAINTPKPAAPTFTGHGMPGAKEILAMPKATRDALDTIELGFANKLTASVAKYLSDLGDPPEHRTFGVENKTAVVKMLTSAEPTIQQVAKWYAAFSKRFTDVENNVRYCLDVPLLAPLAQALKTKYRSGATVTPADLQTLIDAIEAQPGYSPLGTSSAWVRTLEQTRDLI